MRCENCRFANLINDLPYVSCRFNPPQDFRTHHGWPEVQRHEWCGKFEPRVQSGKEGAG